MKTFAIRGVPLAMQRDGWWLAPPAEPQETPKARDARPSPFLRPLLLIALIALGDSLMWGVVPGLSVGLFALALCAAAILVIEPQLSPRRAGFGGIVAVLAVLPVVELVQPLSVLILAVGLSLSLAIIAGLSPDRLCAGAARLWYLGPWQSLRDGIGMAANGGPVQVEQSQLRALVLGWGVPVLIGGAFALLFATANPMVERWIAAIIAFEWLEFDVLRFGFWGLLGVIAWPCLILFRLRERMRARRATVKAPRQIALLNGPAILRSLVLFNVMFAGQTLIDIYYLYGVGTLPDGMSYATYAHRGAYPLLATALLAGGFALISRPFAREFPLLRLLLLIWVAQTLALVAGSLVRLDLYVDTYGLTHWRMAAAIWMGLVAVCLALIWAQIWKDKPNGWMMLRVSGAGAAVLFVCSFVSFDATIVRYNFSHDVREDRHFVCGLSEDAIPVILEMRNETSDSYCSNRYRSLTLFTPNDWREWGFRNWRTRRTLAAMTQSSDTP